MSSRYWKIIAIAVGILLAGAPMAAFNFWLTSLIERQGQDEVDLTARRTIALAERRVAQVLAGLADLNRRGVDSCRAAHLDIMKKTVFATPPVKEISIVGSNGQTLCSDGSVPSGIPRQVIGSQPLAGEGTALDIIRIGEGQEKIVRIRRASTSAPVWLAALIPAEFLISQVATQGGPLNGNARMLLRDGTVLAHSGAAPDVLEREPRFVSSRESEKFGLHVIMSLSRASVAESNFDLRELGFVVTGVIAFVIGAFALLVPWRQHGNPVADLERALGNGEFVPYYQPIVDIASGRLRGAEVLMRWRKRDGSVVSPGSFIPLAESSGLILDMTRALMKQARDDIGAAYEFRPELKVNFNLAARHFDNEHIVEDVRAIFEGSPIQFSQIVLELTERQPLENLAAARRVITAIQSLGVKVAIDDVGAGHSGLSYMLKLGVDVIKIDKIFIDALGSDGNSMTIIETLVDLAKNMRMEIVAEGVENFEQAVALREHGVRAAQGYLFAPPLPGSSFLRLVEAIEPVEQKPVSRADNRAA